MSDGKANNIYACVERKIEFYHVDPMNVVWHGNYLNFFEDARAALLNKIGYSYKEMKESGFAFPVTEISLKYIKPVLFGENIIIKATLDEYENRIVIKFEIKNKDTGVVTTRGRSTQMAFNIEKNISSFVCPDILIGKVETLLGMLPCERE